MLEGREFYVLTDHKPLTFSLHRTTDAWSARQQRQLSYLAEYTSSVRPVSEVNNVMADAFSQPAAMAGPAVGGSVSLVEQVTTQAKCVETCKLAERQNVQQVHVQGLDLLCEASGGSLETLVPEDCRRRVFNSVHSLAHPGVHATRRMVTSRYSWPGCGCDVEAWSRDCQQCGRNKAGHPSMSFLPCASGPGKPPSLLPRWFLLSTHNGGWNNLLA